MSSFLENIRLNDDLKEKLYSASDKVLNYVNERPLWVKLTVGTSLISYIYIRYKWTALNGCGVEVIPPKLSTIGTMSQYFGTDTYVQWAEEELLKKNRHTVGFYRATTPTILTVDEELIRLTFATHFGSFPTRVPGGGSVGAGPIFGHTLDVLSDMPRWKRLRSTLAVGFSTRQLNEMVVAINNSIENFTRKVGSLNGEAIEAKLLASNFAVDAFTTAAFSMTITADEPIASFDKVPFVKNMIDFLTPSVAILIPLLIPYGGEICDALGTYTFPKSSMNFFEKFCRQFISQRKESSEGRTSDFMNLMLKSEISENEKSSATRGMSESEMIAQLFIFFIAGYETTATTVTVILSFLARHPQYIEKIRKEAEQEITDMNSFTSESIPYTCAVLNEALRLVGPVGFNFRVAVIPGSGELELAGVKIKNGFNVEVPYDLLHIHPDYWGSNAKDFYPERWIENPDLEKSWFYQPFGGGPRNCIGMRLALMEIKLGVMKIIQKFDPMLSSTDSKFQRNSFGFIESNPPLKMKFKAI